MYHDVKFNPGDHTFTAHMGQVMVLHDGADEVAALISAAGSVYVSVSPDSPADLFGGAWEQIPNTVLPGVYMWKCVASPSEPTVTGVLKSADGYVLLDINSVYLKPKEVV